MTEQIRYQGLNFEASSALKDAMEKFLEHIATGGDSNSLILLARVIDTQQLKWITQMIGIELRPGGLEYLNGVMAGMGDVSNIIKVLTAPKEKPVERTADPDTEIQALIQQHSKPV